MDFIRLEFTGGDGKNRDQVRLEYASRHRVFI